MIGKTYSHQPNSRGCNNRGWNFSGKIVKWGSSCGLVRFTQRALRDHTHAYSGLAIVRANSFVLSSRINKHGTPLNGTPWNATERANLNVDVYFPNCSELEREQVHCLYKYKSADHGNRCSFISSNGLSLKSTSIFQRIIFT